jgi:beta-glucosidase
MHRHPLGGRNFESYSEDPYLAGKLAVQTVLGLESVGVSATIKHFAANEQETDRLTVDTIVSERALREIYLKPFEYAIKEGKPGAVMTAYNMVNGTHADSNEFLLKQVLRGEWGWDGLVMSDWYGVNSTAESLNAGLDLEMPGPTRWRNSEQIHEAIKAGKLTESVVDERTLRVLGFLERQRCFKDPEIPAEKSIDKPGHRALIREAGAKGIVLLKNEDNILPLTKEKLKGKKVALLGYAKEALAHGGGSAAVTAHYKITPWDALNKAFEGSDVEFVYAHGAHVFRQLPTLSSNIADTNGKCGWTCSLFKSGTTQPDGNIDDVKSSEISLLQHEIIGKDIKLESTYTAPQTGEYYATLSGLGPSKVMVNGKVIAEQTENCSDPMAFILGGVSAPRVGIRLEAGEQYKFEITSSPLVSASGGVLGFIENKAAVRLGWMLAAEHDKDVLAEAVEVAKSADYAVVFTGHDPNWETEGQDQFSFNLPKEGSQDRLVSSVASVNSNTIVVNSTGVAVALPWLDQVKGLLQAWFPGQEAGNAIADVLTGLVVPQGHLTCSFPKALEDCPAYGNFPGTNADGQRTVKYEEGVFIGYRHFDRLPADKLNFPFGFGLSYTTFEYSELSVRDDSSDGFVATVKVSNTGTFDAPTAVQLYVGSKETKPDNPTKALASFKKVNISAGATVTVELPVKTRDFAFWSETNSHWSVEEGQYNFSIGRNARDLVAVQEVAVKGQTWDR